jgi:hypothetical protein
MLIANIKKSLLDIESSQINIYKSYLALLPDIDTKYLISIEVLSKYDLNQVQIFFESYKDYFDKIEVNAIREYDSYIIVLQIWYNIKYEFEKDYTNKKQIIYEVIYSLYMTRKYFNNKELHKLLTGLMGISDYSLNMNEYMYT